VPRAQLVAVIEPVYPKSGRVGRLANRRGAHAAHVFPATVVQPVR
jgi:hypothetical protein